MVGYFYIRSKKDGTVISPPEDGDRVSLQQLATSNNENQQWSITQDNRIQQRTSGKVLETGDNSEGTHVHLKDYNATDNKQIWRVHSSGLIEETHTGYYMKADDDEIEMDSLSNKLSLSRQWILIPVDHTYDIAFTNKPYNTGGLFAGVVQGIANMDIVRLGFYYRDNDQQDWTLYSDPVIPRPNGSFSVHVPGAQQYAVMMVRSNIKLPSSPDKLYKVGGDVLYTKGYTPAGPPLQYSLYTNSEIPAMLYGSINQGTSDFTIEFWARTYQQGVFFSQMNQTPGNGGWHTMAVWVNDSKGGLGFGIADQQKGYSSYVLSNGNTNILDDSWHHIACLRRGNALQIYLDGQLLDGETNNLRIQGANVTLGTADDVSSIDLNSNILFTGLGTYEIDYGSHRSPFILPITPNISGFIDNVRLWQKALWITDIRNGMYSAVDNSDPLLLANWEMNDRNNSDSSIYDRDFTKQKATYANNFVSPIPQAQPYMQVQSKLMEDYEAPNAHSKVTSYRTTVTLFDPSNTRMPNAKLYLKADRQCQIMVATSNGTTKKTITTGLTEFTTNGGGQFSFAYTTHDELEAPMFWAQAEFMDSDEYLVIAADRQAHYDLATVTGHQLTSSKTALSNKLKQNNVTGDAADALASAINNFMSISVESDVQSDHKAVRLQNETVDQIGKPLQRLYQNTFVAYQPYTPLSDVIAPDYLQTTSTQQKRVVNGLTMPAKYWAYNTAGVFREINESQFDTHYQSSPASMNKLAAVHRDMRATGKKKFTRKEINDIVARHNHVTEFISWDGIKHALENGAQVVVGAVDYVFGDDAADAVESVLDFVVMTVEDLGDFVINTVTDAVNAVTTLFEQFEVEAAEIVDFLKGVFEWNDIVETQFVLQAVLQNAIPTIQQELQGIEQTINNQFDSWRSTIDQRIDSIIDTFSTQTVEDGREAATDEQPGDVQSSYLQTSINTYGGDSTTIGFTPTPEDQSTIERAITQIQNALAANVNIIKQEAIDANVWELFSSPEAIFNYSVVVVVDVLKTMIDTALILIEAGIDLIFDLISDILGILDTVMKSRIYIPFVTDLYESVISPGNTLNLYSLFALLGAAPFTITYKTLKGHKPFDEQALAASRQLSPANYRMMLTATSSKKSSPSPYLPLVIVSNGLAFVASGAMIAASGLATLDGLAQGSVLTFARWKVAAELVIQLCGTPIYLGDSTGNFQTSLYDSLIWVSQFIPLLLDGASVVTDSTGNLAQTFFKTFSDIVKPGATFAYGIFHAFAFLGLAIDEIVVGAHGSASDIAIAEVQAILKGIINLISTLIELDDILLYYPETKPIPPAIDMAAFGIWGIGTFTRTILDISLDAVTAAR